MKAYLGGTLDSDWRERLIPLLMIDYVDPTVRDRNKMQLTRSLQARKECDILLYVVTPKIDDVYSIAEAIDDSHKRPGRVVFTFLTGEKKKRYTSPQFNALSQVGLMVRRNGGHWLSPAPREMAKFLNEFILPRTRTPRRKRQITQE